MATLALHLLSGEPSGSVTVTQEAGGCVPAGEASPPHVQDGDKPGLAGRWEEWTPEKSSAWPRTSGSGGGMGLSDQLVQPLLKE